MTKFPCLLRADHTPVGAADGDRSRTRAAARGPVGPGTDGYRVLRVVARWVIEWQFAWMLHVDEKRAQVWRLHHSRDLAAARADQKAPDFAGRRIGGEHLVVADAGPILSRHVTRGGVGLNPQHAPRVDIKTVGLSERDIGGAALK